MIGLDVDKIRDLAWEFRKAAELRSEQLTATYKLTNTNGTGGVIRDRQADMLAELAEQVYILSQRG